MRVWLAFMLVLAFFYEGDEGPSGYLRRFQNVVIAPYHQTEGTTIYFEFSNQVVDSITLTFRVTNLAYTSVVVYSQSFPPLALIQKAIPLPGSLFVGSTSTLQLSAVRSGFSLHEWVTLYPLQHLSVSVLEGGYASPPTITRIDSEGKIRYEREQLVFLGMEVVQTYHQYGRLDISSMGIQIQSPIARELIFEEAYLLIADHPAYEGLSYQTGGYRILPMTMRLMDDVIHLHFSSLYVHPQTLLSSNQSLLNYQPTQYLYFPPQAFLALKEQPMLMYMKFQHFHQMTLIYNFLYEGIQPILGTCWQSVYCVNVYA
jgi:hypothetical protein